MKRYPILDLDHPEKKARISQGLKNGNLEEVSFLLASGYRRCLEIQFNPAKNDLEIFQGKIHVHVSLDGHIKFPENKYRQQAELPKKQYNQEQQDKPAEKKRVRFRR